MQQENLTFNVPISLLNLKFYCSFNALYSRGKAIEPELLSVELYKGYSLC